MRLNKFFLLPLILFSFLSFGKYDLPLRHTPESFHSSYLSVNKTGITGALEFNFYERKFRELLLHTMHDAPLNVAFKRLDISAGILFASKKRMPYFSVDTHINSLFNIGIGTKVSVGIIDYTDLLSLDIYFFNFFPLSFLARDIIQTYGGAKIDLNGVDFIVGFYYTHDISENYGISIETNNFTSLFFIFNFDFN